MTCFFIFFRSEYRHSFTAWATFLCSQKKPQNESIFRTVIRTLVRTQQTGKICREAWSGLAGNGGKVFNRCLSRVWQEQQGVWGHYRNRSQPNGNLDFYFWGLHLQRQFNWSFSSTTTVTMHWIGIVWLLKFTSENCHKCQSVSWLWNRGVTKQSLTLCHPVPVSVKPPMSFS